MGRYAIFVVFGLFLTMNYFLVSSHKSERLAIQSSVETLNRRMAQNIATGFANITLSRLRVDQVGISGFDADDYHINKDVDRPEGMHVSLDVDNFETDGNLDIGEYRITSVAEYEGETVTTVVFDRPLPFSYWALFLNSFPALYYGNGEGADGPVHINGRLGIGQIPGPTWDGNVTTSDGIKYYGGLTSTSYKGFHGDTNNFNHRKITMPTNLGLSADAISSSYKLDSLFPSSSSTFLSVTLRRDASGVQWLDVCDVRTSDPKLQRASWATDAAWQAYLAVHAASVKLSDVTSGIVYSARFHLRLRGELDGQLTIGTEKKMYIDDDVYYHDDPRTNPASDDLLGLMATSGMVISTSADPNTGYKLNNDYSTAGATYPGCMIMANMYTPGGITIESYTDGRRGDWTVVGGRVQQTCSQTWSGNDYSWTGFKEVIVYDDRLRKMTPPGIPYTMERRISRWQETF